MSRDIHDVGPLRIDVTERRVSLRGAPLDLTGKPFDLLVLLAENAGSLVRHQEILDEVWPDTTVEPNNVAHNISILRKALSAANEVQIENVPRQGYRLSATGIQPTSPFTLNQTIGFCRASDGTRLAYAHSGKGPALVKVANWLSHVELDWTSPIWRHWLDYLTDDRFFLRYDARGNGLSEWTVNELSFELYVRDLERVMDAVGIERAPLLGISQGAAVAAAFAARHPERVSALVLLGGCVRGWRTKGHVRLTQQFEALMTLMRNGWGQDNPTFRQIFTTAFFPDASAEQASYFNELQRTTTTPDNAARMLDAIGDIDIRDDLASIHVPTLVLHARRDTVVPFRDGLELATGIDGAHFVPLDSSNHVLLDEEPAWERFRDETRRFLTGLSEVSTFP